jgi:hypothetical protein
VLGLSPSEAEPAKNRGLTDKVDHAVLQVLALDDPKPSRPRCERVCEGARSRSRRVGSYLATFLPFYVPV